MKLNPAKIQECAEWVAKNGLIDYGGAKLKDFLKAMRIDQRTYYRWLDRADFADSIEKAKEEFKIGFLLDSVESLRKLATGYDVTETHTEFTDVNGVPRVKKQIQNKKHVGPNTAAVIFALTNLDPEHWKQRQFAEITGKDGAPIETRQSGLSIAEAKAMLDEVEADI